MLSAAMESVSALRKGMSPFRLRTKVKAFLMSSRRRTSASGVLSSLRMFSTWRESKRVRPRRYLERSIRRTLSMTWARSRRPSAKYALISRRAALRSSGSTTTSLPANSASAETTPGGKYLVTPFISRASVKISPLNPNSLRKRLVTILRERVAGRLGRSSRAGTCRWLTITLPTP